MHAEPETYRYVRNLPHWRQTNAVYFVTWRLHPSQTPLAALERDLVQAAITWFEHSRYALSSYVVMDDHVHVLVQPYRTHRLENIVGAWKGYSSKRIIQATDRRTPLWQPGYFDRIVRDERELAQKSAYVQNNPFKRWPELSRYPWMQ